MRLKGIIHEDFVNYKKPAMVLEFPFCSFKCDKECGKCVCQNSLLAKNPIYEIKTWDIIFWYLNNPISESIVCQGLEPMDSFIELENFIQKFRKYSKDDIIIYTGYYPEEIQDKIYKLKQYENIIVKFGRYIPNKETIYSSLLGVELASNNQFAKRIS